MDLKQIIPFLAMPLLLLAVEIGSILISLPVQAAGITAFEDPTSIANRDPVGIHRFFTGPDQI
jgi:hypothetical protein